MTEIVVTVITLAALLGASMLFNRYIDRRPVTKRADAETALWVVAGTLYTLAGAAVLFAVWAPYLPRDWRLGLIAMGVMLAAFAASGAPMVLGDMRRSQDWRRTNEELDKASYWNGGGK